MDVDWVHPTHGFHQILSAEFDFYCPFWLQDGSPGSERKERRQNRNTDTLTKGDNRKRLVTICGTRKLLRYGSAHPQFTEVTLGRGAGTIETSKWAAREAWQKANKTILIMTSVYFHLKGRRIQVPPSTADKGKRSHIFQEKKKKKKVDVGTVTIEQSPSRMLCNEGSGCRPVPQTHGSLLFVLRLTGPGQAGEETISLTPWK